MVFINIHKLQYFSDLLDFSFGDILQQYVP